MTSSDPFWPNNARLAVSLSLMFEAGGQPISGAGGVIPDPIEKGLPDLPTNAFFQYGVYEVIPRILDLMDKHKIKLSSFMIGQAVEKAPDLAREIDAGSVSTLLILGCNPAFTAPGAETSTA